MKILYSSDILGPHDYRFLRALAQKKYDVLLVSYRKLEEGQSQEQNNYNVSDIFGLSIIHEPSLSKNSYINLLKRLLHFKKVIKDYKPDLIHAGWIQTSGFIAALSGFRPILLMPWGSDIFYYSRNNLRNRLISRFTISASDMITCDCFHEKELLMKIFGYPEKRIEVIPWDVDLERFKSRDNKDALKQSMGFGPYKILIMNRIFRKEYGIENFLKILPFVVKDFSQLKVLLVGYGPQEEELKAIAKKEKINDFIIWTGYVNEDKMIDYLNLSDIYISTSLMDGSSSSLLEAMACKLPVVASDIFANREWVADGINGFIVDVNDQKLFAEKIVSLLKDQDLREKMGLENVKKVKEKADFRKNFEKLELLYGRLVNK